MTVSREYENYGNRNVNSILYDINCIKRKTTFITFRESKLNIFSINNIFR